MHFAFLKKYWPISFLFFIEGILFAANYTPGTYLAGWDNIMPEFDFKTNIIRNLVGVWQEYRGLGLYDGMSHAASTLHTIILWLMTIVVPQSMLRYVFIFCMHLLGGIGIYIFINTVQQQKYKLVSLIGALFYLFNPATIQLFYTPLESFAIHFAILPWLFLTIIQFLHDGKKQSYLAFCIVTLLATTQFFIPTLVISIGLVIGSCILFSLRHWKRGLAIILGFLCINAFWLAPFLYGSQNIATTATAAKINQMSSGEAYLRNVAFGDIGSVLTLKGYPIDFQDMALNEQTPTIMTTWKILWDTPLSRTYSILLATVSIIGMVYLVKQKKLIHIALPLIILWICSFIMLANNTIGIRELTQSIRNTFPVIAELFRFPFTKFATIFSFVYAIAIVYGVLYLCILCKRKTIVYLVASSIIVFSTISLAIPSFTGNFIYPSLRITIPIYYQSLFQYMQKQNPSGKILLLPQPDYWSWKYYRFGYRGSGFMWFGIPQPLLDRAFDPWSTTNEASYWEVSHTLYAKDAKALRQVLQKYAITYLLMDEHQVNSSHTRALFMNELFELLHTMPDIRKIDNFGGLTLYVVNNSLPPVTTITNVPSIPTNNQFVDVDSIYEQVGTYSNTYSDTQDVDVTYPFQSLFTKRSVQERSFIVQETNDKITITAKDSHESFSIDKKTAFQEEATLSGTLRFQNQKNRQNITISFDSLWHRQGYLVQVVSKHISGQPMTIAFINKTAKHTELETFLPTKTEWQTTYFMLPPLSIDGKGYDVYLSNENIAGAKTINDIAAIRFYTLPYMNIIQTAKIYKKMPPEQTTIPTQIVHPNPTYYAVTLAPSQVNATLILNQSFDPGWHAYIKSGWRLTTLRNHVRINNWANGWTLDPQQKDTTIIIFFAPQLLQWFGFLLIPLPFVLMIHKRSI